MGVFKDKTIKENAWYFTVEIRESGKRTRKKFRGYKTKKEAEVAEAAMLTAHTKGDILRESSMLYKDFLINNYLQNKKTNIRKSTMQTYSWLINKYVIPELGSLKLSELSPARIVKMYNSITTSGKLASENVQKIHTLVKDSLNLAHQWDLVKKNVTNNVNRPKAIKNEIEVWELPECKAFLEAAKGDRLYIAFLLALTTGMRQGEILGLRWKDVDLKNSVIHVIQSLSHNGKEFHKPKTKAGTRKITISEEILYQLRAQKSMVDYEKKENEGLYKDFDLVVCTNVGTPVIPRNLCRSFYRLTSKADVKKIRFHETRHSFATLLLKQNVNPKIVAEILGHADTRITLDTYSHLLPSLQKDVSENFSKMFFDD